MRILKRFENEIKVKPEIVEDLWHLGKIILPGDFASGSTTRKFVSEAGDAERKAVTVKIHVEKVEFHEHSRKLKVLGKITGGHPEEYVQIGKHHSLEIGEGDVISIFKEEWAKYEIDRLHEAEKAAKRPKIFVLVMDERDAELFKIKEYGIDPLGKISGGHGKKVDDNREAKHKWYSEIFDLIADKEKIIIAGPGFEKDNFAKFADGKSKKPKSSVESIGNTGKQGVYELINKGIIDKTVKENRFVEETKTIERLIREVSAPQPKAVYGFGKVKEAVEMGAVESLLVLDSFLFEKKGELDELIRSAEKFKTKVFIISHENEMSEKLKALGKIAAMLRFAIE